MNKPTIKKFDSRKHNYQLQFRDAGESTWLDLFPKPNTEKSMVAEYVRLTHNSDDDTQWRVFDIKRQKLIVGGDQ